jgi:hypothetical protein
MRSQPHLYHFTESEFERGGRNWFSDMSPRLLVCLDICRYRWSEYHHESMPITISQHPQAIGRIEPTYVVSDHNFAGHNEVRGIDVLPEGMVTREDAEAFVRIATESGVTAIGLYPFWKPQAGIHLGDRRTARPGSPATWGGIPSKDKLGEQDYISLNDALELMPE